MAKVSVCIPVYNVAPRFLKAVLESVACQTYDKIETVVVDDASDVDYERVLSECDTALDFTYYRHDRNLGMVANWNAAVRLTSSDLVVLVGHDDVLMPDMVEAYVGVIQASVGVVACGGARQFIDEMDRLRTTLRFVSDRRYLFEIGSLWHFEFREIARLALSNGNVVGEPSCVMFRREVFDEVGGYDSSFEHAADLDFVLRVAERGRIAYLGTPHVLRRLHGENQTVLNQKSGAVARDRVRIYNRFGMQPVFSESERRRFRTFLVFSMIKDLLRGVRWRSWITVRRAFREMRPYLEWAPIEYLRYLIEVLTWNNRDAKRSGSISKG